jgi:hypothetical protein
MKRVWSEYRRITNKKKELGSIKKSFETALRSSIEQDLLHDVAAKDFYLNAMKDIVSTDGVQLQAMVSAAALAVPAIRDANRRNSVLISAVIVLFLAKGVLIGLLRFYR